MHSLLIKSQPDRIQPSRYLRIPMAAALALMTLAVVATAFPAFAATPAVTITMTDKPARFHPQEVTIKEGQTVKWMNNAKTLHSVDADPSAAQKKGDVSLPKGAKPFDSGFLQPGMSYEYTFTVPGVYKYTCLPHEKDGMNGVVVVK
ncbi:MAG: cupredoxin domain-containing protein [Candidatus Binataceae bacterium]